MYSSFQEILDLFTEQGYVSNPDFVYKNVRMHIVVLKRTPNTITNEGRDEIADSNCAKFRGSEFEVVQIVDILNINNKSINNLSNTFYNNSGGHHKIKYIVGEIITPDKFDENINNICSGGIHYFKTIRPAYFYIPIVNYSGCWIDFHDNGIISGEGKYTNGARTDKWTYWYSDGSVSHVGRYYSGLWLEFDDKLYS